MARRTDQGSQSAAVTMASRGQINSLNDGARGNWIGLHVDHISHRLILPSYRTCEANLHIGSPALLVSGYVARSFDYPKDIRMRNRISRSWFAALAFAAMLTLSAAANASMSGIDHLADNLSVTDFWVNGTGGFQAGQGGRSAPAPALPDEWHPGLTVHVVWHVRDWEHDTGSTHEADVPVEPYSQDGGHVWVHFLANGTVRVVVSNMGPRSPTYPGPHDPIPQKNPWDRYPPRIDWRDMKEHLADIAISKQHCATASDPRNCVKQAREKLLDEQRVDARLYLPRCALITERYISEECERQAEQSMRAARLARRCQAAPQLAECLARKAELRPPKPMRTPETER